MIADFKDWLANFLPYSLESWKGLLEYYNQIWWPYSVVFLALALGLLWLVRRPSPHQHRFVLSGLALCWAWTGWFFVGKQFATVNWSARYFAWLFILQALILVAWSLRSEPQKSGQPVKFERWSPFLVFTSMMALPLIQFLSGYSLEQLGWFALTPDATVLATIAFLGVLNVLPAGLWAIPVVWSLVVFANSWPLGDIAGMCLLPLVIAQLLLFKLRRAT